ncbi:MAG: HAD-IC family P-type ATPase [Myxococcales bacterium]|nr:HAD-IC family P-type ATPase [Myxococcales bacterium]
MSGTTVAVDSREESPLIKCLHCSLPIGTGQRSAFCCHGCEAVYSLLHEGELERYYALRSGPGTPVVDRPAPSRDLSWLVEAYQDDSTETQRHLRLDIQGIHCSGCVWVLEKTFSRRAGALKLMTNPALGKIELWVAPEFPLDEWLYSVERFGYRFGPSLKDSDARVDSLLLRVGISIALALNVMVLSAALYVGLEEGLLYRVFRALSYGLASLSVVVGAPIFFRSAIAGLRNRVLHLDVPISLGIALTFAGSSWAFWTGRDNALYLDSVSVFIALMLLGRYLQERVLSANRNRLLASEGTEGLRSKRLSNHGIEVIKSLEILSGDQLLVAPGDLVPVAAKLLSPQALVSTDWISGESRARQHREGGALQAGSFNAGDQAFKVEATTDFDSSPLQALLCPSSQSDAAAHETGLIRTISKYYVAAVLLAALGGFSGWLLASGSLVAALEVATAVLVVSCPCAFGIATPLAHELVQSRLRGKGLYIRNGDFMGRLNNVQSIVFDKTGTLTSGQLTLAPSAELDALTANERDVLFTLASHSNHPVSSAVCRELRPKEPTLLDHTCVTELPGMGMECRLEGGRYRMGQHRWATDESAGEGTVFVCDDRILAPLSLLEEVRSDAHSEIKALSDAGYKIYLLSGDSPDRVARLAIDLGIEADNALASQTPTDKQRWLQKHDRGDMLFVGDGINDSLAAKTASCSGTPALDRPFMASNCDFYLGTSNISPIRDALSAAGTLMRVVRRNLAFAVIYNILAIALAWAGLMRPWLAAILMPSSSILIVLATTISLSPRSARWKS